MAISNGERLERIRGRVLMARQFVEHGRHEKALLHTLSLILQECERGGAASSAAERFRDAMEADR